MLNNRTDNFNDFSRYYSEENQELLEKKSKWTLFLPLSIVLFIMLFSYLIYIYLLKQNLIENNTNKNDSFKSKIITKNTPTSPIAIPKIHIEKPILVEKEKPILVEKEKPILVEKEKPILAEKEKPILVKKERPVLAEKEFKTINTIKESDKKNLNNLSSQLKKIVNKNIVYIEE